MHKNKPIKVALLGGIRAGKDTLAGYLKAHTLGPVQEVAFSDGIHNIIKEYLPDAYKQGKPRKELQGIGQYLRQYDSDVWIKYLFNSRRYTEAIDAGKSIFVTDVRQPNEVKALHEHGFTIIKVVADTATRIRRAKEVGDNFTESDLKHETERYADSCQDYNYLVVNDGTLDELDNKALSIIAEMQK